MRILSEYEKKLCNKILGGSTDNNFLANVIDSDLDGSKIEINKQIKQ
ncbi:hypothetical protein GCM10027275_14670 [Rhabdobacter roseus]|uniref:Uncharacterized protein n=1 Tax=Rhabdobacter roseus TaxID=1655419 RepID=A0A840TNQ8_9BACT|nr:hypothetical protein [Rhabdobacter roseus]MBB5283387.1 hypothetical protein [Rhabdobacter roseus]